MLRLGTGHSLSLICQPTSEDMKLYINNNNNGGHRAQELCESRRGHPGLRVPNKPYGTEPEDGSHHTDSLWTRAHGISRTACLRKWVTAMAIATNIQEAKTITSITLIRVFRTE